MEKRTCWNQLIRTLPSTEPERIAIPREVEDLQSKRFDSRVIRSTPPLDNAHLRLARHCMR
jgi:hypothetical protein